MKKLDIEQLEQRLKDLIAEHLARYLPGSEDEAFAARQLANAIFANTQEKEGHLYAPHAYTLIAHPALIERWQKEDALAEAFLQILSTIAEEAEFEFETPPTLSLTAEKGLAQGVVRVLASHRAEPTTQETPSEENADSSEMPKNAFLIVHGTKVFPLDKPVIDVGRRINNHLVLDDPRVSRSHAQIRAIKGRFVIFDLNSTGGTFVNGQRIKQSVLYPGDVVSLAGVPLIFGQDNPPQRSDLAQTSPFSSSASERPTAILKKKKS